MVVECFECSCYSDEHRLVFNLDDGNGLNWRPELYCSTFLCQHQNVFRRLWVAAKYVLGYKCKYGHFDCFIMREEDVGRFQKLILKFKKLSTQWANSKLGRPERSKASK